MVVALGYLHNGTLADSKQRDNLAGTAGPQQVEVLVWLLEDTYPNNGIAVSEQAEINANAQVYPHKGAAVP